MDFLSREQLLVAHGRTFKEIEIPELGGTLRLGSPSAAALMRFRKLEREENGALTADSIAKVIAACVVDGKGAPLLKEADVLQMLEMVGPDVATRLLNESLEMLADGKKDADAGNSEPSPSAS